MKGGEEMNRKAYRVIQVMGFFGMLSVCLVGGGCHTFFAQTPAMNNVVESYVAPPLTSMDLDMHNMSKVRSPERLKAYPIGRYIDPNDAQIMHEGHVVYRSEAPSAWNKHPNAPTAVPLGPVVAISHPERQKELLNVEYETKIMQQNQLMKSLIDQNEALLDLVSQLKEEINKMKHPGTT